MYHQDWYPGEEEIAVKCPEPGCGTLLHSDVCCKQLAGQVFVKGSKVMTTTGSRTTNRNSHWLRPYGCKFTAHLPSSPHVLLTEFHFFVRLKETAVRVRFVTEAGVKRAVTSSTDVDGDLPLWDSSLGTKVRQIFKSEWRLRGSLMCAICYPSATCILKSEKCSRRRSVC